MVSIEDILDHVKRAHTWRIVEVIPHQEEAEKLTEEAIHNELIRSFLAWRRSLLFFAIPATCVNGVLSLLGLLSLEDLPLNTWGYLVSVLQALGDPILFAAVVYSLIKWTDYKKSMLVIRYGWIVSFVFPLVQALFPLEFMIDDDVMEASDPTYIAAIKMILALQYALALLPVLITFPGGMVQATLHARGLFPHSSLAGWIMMFCAPFHSVIVCVAFVVLTQVAGNFLLLLGTLLLCSAPWCFLFRAKLFIGESTPEIEKQLDITTRVKSMVSLTGILLVLLWGLTANVSGVKPIGSGKEIDNDGDGISDVTYLKTYTQFVLFIFEYISNEMVTKLLFTDIMIVVTFWNSTIDKKRRDNGATAEMDKACVVLSEFLGNNYNPLPSSGNQLQPVQQVPTFQSIPQPIVEQVQVIQPVHEVPSIPQKHHHPAAHLSNLTPAVIKASAPMVQHLPPNINNSNIEPDISLSTSSGIPPTQQPTPKPQPPSPPTNQHHEEEDEIEINLSEPPADDYPPAPSSVYHEV